MLVLKLSVFPLINKKNDHRWISAFLFGKRVHTAEIVLILCMGT